MWSVGVRLSVACAVAAGAAPGGETPQSSADETVIAVVLGKNITARDKDRLDGLVFGALLQRYAKDRGIAASEEEITAFVTRTAEQERRAQAQFARERQELAAQLRSGELGERERKDKEARLALLERLLKSNRELQERTKGREKESRQIERAIARDIIERWKVNRALFHKYGGRVIFQQAGVEPVDAYRDFLREEQRKGSFRILDKRYEPTFWRYFTNDAMHTFYPGDDGAKLLETPWWLLPETGGR